jgi:hypothetical protein
MAALDSGSCHWQLPLLGTVSVPPSASRAPSVIPRIRGVLSSKCAALEDDIEHGEQAQTVRRDGRPQKQMPPREDNTSR